MEADKMISHNAKATFRHNCIMAVERLLNAVIMLIIMSGLSCKSQSSERKIEREPLLSTWQSKNVSAKERTDAANKWIPAGTDGETVKNLLGIPSTGWNHFHGPSF